MLNELKTEFDRYIRLKERLDNKTNNMIAMSGTVATLFMGFGVFLLEQVDTSSMFLHVFAIVILLAEVTLTSITIKYLINAYKLKNYSYPIYFDRFYNDVGELDHNNIREFTDMTEDNFNTYLIRAYLLCLRANDLNNSLKAKQIEQAHRTFIGAIVSIPIFAFIVILASFV